MSFKNAALKILRESGRPMHTKEITSIALKSGLIITTGKTPEATMNARLGEDIKNNGYKSLFVKTGPSIFSLRDSVSPKSKTQATNRSSEIKAKSVDHAKSDKLNNANKLLEHLGSFDKTGRQLEKIVCELLELDSEYKNPTTTPASKDQGVDVVADYLGDKFAAKCRVIIQVKNYKLKTRIGPDPIRKLRGSGQRNSGYNYKFWLITTGEFTPAAHGAAMEDPSRPVKLTDGKELARMLIKSNIGISWVFPENF